MSSFFLQTSTPFDWDWYNSDWLNVISFIEKRKTKDQNVPGFLVSSRTRLKNEKGIDSTIGKKVVLIGDCDEFVIQGYLTSRVDLLCSGKDWPYSIFCERYVFSRCYHEVKL